MLDIVNGLANSWTALPVVRSFARRGLFQTLAHTPMTREEIASRFQANAGHLHAALRLLHELEWVEVAEDGNYRAAPLVQAIDHRLEDLDALLHVAVTVSPLRTAPNLLRGWLARCGKGWEDAHPALISLFDGAVLTPLLAELHALGTDSFTDTPPIDEASSMGWNAVHVLFEQREWGAIKPDGFQLSAAGRSLLASCGALGTVLSYASMFYRMDELLFGQADTVFVLDEHGHESHVDRTINVVASGVQHQSHFAELETLIIGVFDCMPLESQPRYVADMGCGDGTLLRRIHEVVRTRTQRGKVLDQLPLMLIGIDYNARSLEATARTLATLPHYLLHGDVADPQQLMRDLVAQGITELEQILHVRTFLDHDRPFLPVKDETAAARRCDHHYTGVYTTRDGREIKAAYAVQSLVEHLQRWREAITGFGLVLLEVHCLQPDTVRRLQNQTESAHYDAFHAFSGQQLVEAPVFLMAAAEAGLFPAPGASRCIPKTADFTRISLHHLRPRAYLVRHPALCDLPALEALDTASQPAHLRTSIAELQRRLRDYPQGQMVLQLDGQIVAALYSQRIESIDVLRAGTYRELDQWHRQNGRYVQLIGLFVLPDMQGRGYSDALIELMLTYCATLDGVDGVTGVTRCANYTQRKAACDIETYIRQRDTQGQRIDAMLHFHYSHGATIVEVLPRFREEDVDNDGAGVLIEYPLRGTPSTQVADERRDPAPAPEALAIDAIKPTVRSVILQVLGREREAAFGEHVPFMEMGLGSLELLELRRLLSARMHEPLPATFFFSYGTPEAVAKHFSAQAAARPIPTPTVSGPAKQPVSAAVQPSAQQLSESTELNTAVAVIGMACRFPGGADTPSKFWENLIEGRDAIGPRCQRRQLLHGHPSWSFHWQAGFIDDVDCFDAAFFRISPREAELLDPQQRLLLEVMWEALESAAIAPSSLRGALGGIFVGLMGNEYAGLIASRGSPSDINAQYATGNACAAAAGRLAYFFDWQGPALSIDTACSSSLVAVHAACNSLLQRECHVAMAAGVNLLLDDKPFMAFDEAGMLSPDGRCKTFDASANGYVRSEGCASVVLKRLSDAERDGDPILAVIRGSAVNQDGSSSGLTAPNQRAQQAVIAAALARAKLQPDQIDYLEAHGTGTKLGDPIEVMAAAAVLGEGRPAEHPLLIGTAKSAIGHLESAAGIAGLIKTVLCVQHGMIPPQLHLDVLNPHVPWERLPVQVVTEATKWPRTTKRAGISSFGFSGTNAHVVVEAYETHSTHITSPKQEGPVAIILSARNEEQLQTQIQQFLQYLQTHDVDLNDLGYTLQVGREHFRTRFGFVAHSIDEVKTKLAQGMEAAHAGDNVWRGAVKDDGGELSLISDEDDSALMIDAWLEKGKLSKLVAGWAQGWSVPWAKLYPVSRPKRLGMLPTYPFAHASYWVPVATPVERKGGAQPASDPTHDVSSALTGDRALCGELEQATLETVLLTPQWKEQVLAPSANPLTYALHGIALCEMDHADTDLIEPLRFALPHARYVRFSADGTLAQRYESYAQQILVWMRRVTTEHPGEPLLLQLITPDDGEGSVLRGLAGLLRGAQHEYPQLTAQLIAVERDVSAKVLAQRLQGEALSQTPVVRYTKRGREVREFEAMETSAEPDLPWRDGGVYLITGGLGGLGQIFARAIAQVRDPVVVLTGRSPLARASEKVLDELRAVGARVEYFATDVSDASALRELIGTIVDKYGQLNGVIHSAGVLRDSLLVTKTAQQVNDVLSTKVSGVLALDQATRDVVLDWVVLCSSVAGVLGNVGQTDYAAANGFMDAYAQYVDGLVNDGRRRGRMLSVSWPLWANGGMQVSEPMQQQLQSVMGLERLPSGVGVKALCHALKQSAAHVVVGYGNRTRVLKHLKAPGSASRSVDADDLSRSAGDAAALKGLALDQRVRWDVTEQLHQMLKLSHDELSPTTHLVEFGVDSIGFTQLARRLSRYYGLSLSPSLFYSYATLQRFSTYLLTNYESHLRRFYQADAAVTTIASDPAAAAIRVGAPAQHPATDSHTAPIAIIGMSGRFPAARTIDEFWQILRDGREVVEEIPAARFNLPTNAADQRQIRKMGALPGVDEFDASFFEISPREANVIDPRQRLLLQESWRALEDAGYGASHIQQHTIGTFVGVEQGDYHTLVGDEGAVTSNHDAILASRLAYALDLHGPAMAINTACSSGLVAAHQACMSLWAGECDTALAASVNLIVTPRSLLAMEQAGMLSPDGRSYVFDRRANGMVPGEAVVALVLKPLAKAQIDGDPIYAVIAGSGINYDGKTQGISAPSGAAQTSLLRSIYQRFQIEPETLDYVVAHGTATPLGDPVEVNALIDAVRVSTQQTGYCALTSTKANVGHTQAASGLVSLVSLVQAMCHHTIPASINCVQESEYITWESSPFFVNKTATPWTERTDRPRYGAVSAFGISGTNAHMVVRSYSPEAVSSPRNSVSSWHLLVLSAKTDAALRAKLEDLRDVLEGGEWNDARLRAMSFTLLRGRQHFAHRCALVVRDRDDACRSVVRALLPDVQIGVFRGNVGRGFEANQATIERGNVLLERAATSTDELDALNESLRSLAHLYCQGYLMTWERLFGCAKVERLHLPTYPFARDHHWFVAQGDTQHGQKSDALQAADTHSSDLLDVSDAMQRIRETVYIVKDQVSGKLAAIAQASDRSLSRDSDLPSGVALLAKLPPQHPEYLGDPTFLSSHGVRFPYVAGEMANGIATVALVVAMARAGMLGFFGSAGLSVGAIEAAIKEIQETLGDKTTTRRDDDDSSDVHPSWGINLIYAPHEPGLERALVELFLRHNVRRISASAFMELTDNVVHFACNGLTIRDGVISRRNYVFAKLSRAEIARQFMSPAPADIVQRLVEQGRITRDEAELAAHVPVAEDVTVEADSGGHTDNRPLTVLLPVILALRDELCAQHGYPRRIRVGAAGGIGNPQSVAAAFMLGAAYVMTGSVNQATVEAGTSLQVKQMLSKVGMTDVTMAPAADMFELGVKVQVLKRGTLYPPRAAKLYQIYGSHGSIDSIPVETRQSLEKEIFHASLDEIWRDTKAYWERRDVQEVERADQDGKHKMALIFRWYLGQGSYWARTAETTRQLDYLIWCGPAMGAFNDWVRGSWLEAPENRHVVQVALSLLESAALVTRAQLLRSNGVEIPAVSFLVRPKQFALG